MIFTPMFHASLTEKKGDWKERNKQIIQFFLYVSPYSFFVSALSEFQIWKERNCYCRQNINNVHSQLSHSVLLHWVIQSWMHPVRECELRLRNDEVQIGYNPCTPEIEDMEVNWRRRSYLNSEFASAIRSKELSMHSTCRWTHCDDSTLQSSYTLRDSFYLLVSTKCRVYGDILCWDKGYPEKLSRYVPYEYPFTCPILYPHLSLLPSIEWPTFDCLRRGRNWWHIRTAPRQFTLRESLRGGINKGEGRGREITCIVWLNTNHQDRRLRRLPHCWRFPIEEHPEGQKWRGGKEEGSYVGFKSFLHELISISHRLITCDIQLKGVKTMWTFQFFSTFLKVLSTLNYWALYDFLLWTLHLLSVASSEHINSLGDQS